ncbi:MAG TPA: T9SS type A sorting domain-containing protein [Bacteroidia bacterium]|nr:T9SS type A sorting domain-containing protein [Bacteroidia bacterium]
MKRFLLRNKGLLAIVVAVMVASSFTLATRQVADARTFHTEDELLRLHEILASLPTDTSSLFAGSGKCGGCHGHDPQGIAFVTNSGEDVNIADDWAGTMMANSAKDPFWRAKVSHEILVNPALQQDIENTCTRCHAPAGRFEAEYHNQLPYAIDSMLNDSIAMDGVNCTVCHQIRDTLLGNNFNGNLFFTHRIAYGPYEDPVSAIMEFFVGWVPEYSPHITQSELCGGCHSLITFSHDMIGNPTGNSFFEQATYHEWKNSIYSTLDSTCQSCHIPRINDSIDIATNYPFLDGRSPFGKHHLVGGNAFMLKLMRQNMTSVGSTCQPSNFDTSIARTARYLRNNTLDINLQYINRVNDTAYYDVELTNKAGHKFPSGYPSRIAWVEFMVIDDQNDTIFYSGEYDGDGNVVNRDPGFEPHRNVITNDAQVQIYEMVMGDVNGSPTTVLERADTLLKDNRMAPKGFLNGHVSYDTMKIAGLFGDPDFNFSGPTEGTGMDVVHFHIPMNGYTGPLLVKTKVWYHAVPRPWLDEMFAYNSAEIDSFRNFYNNADQAPSLVAEAEIDDINLGTLQFAQQNLHVFPNPTSDGKIYIDGWKDLNVQLVRVIDLTGREVITPVSGEQFTGSIVLPDRGVFLVIFETETGLITKRVLWH